MRDASNDGHVTQGFNSLERVAGMHTGKLGLNDIFKVEYELVINVDFISTL